jgi:hypothetical protein
MSEQTRKLAPILREGRHWRVDPVSGCWLWLLFTFKGYGRCQTGQAHREVWRQAGRELSAAQHLHHLCPNKACVNPAHLTPIAPSPHIAQHQRMFSTAILDEIRVLATDPDLTVKAIAGRVGLPRTSVQNILNGDRYAEFGLGGLKPQRLCLLCGEPVGDRRRSARFCSVEHRITYNSRKLAERRREARKVVAS